MDSRKIIGAKLRDAREELGWSGEELGRAFGVSKAQISRYESGVMGFDVDAIRRFETILGKPKGWLESGEELPSPSLKVMASQLSKMQGEILNMKNAIKQGVEASILAGDINELVNRQGKLNNHLTTLQVERERATQIKASSLEIDNVMLAVNQVLNIGFSAFDV